ncbi:YIP1 family protein [Phaeobacter sp. HF9A]|uniref:YIP1 family protein n=1 Tax=Phaeobacter sp. HF9A TaxID=2721561 RepID=UPI001430B0C2|nr:YIP1 family protein [Phaeobacter sp. HF9A]NIZ12251.1 YIP1 family protein [Phaeobacter sp. HF9A]
MDFKSLAVETLTSPAHAARKFLALNLSADVIWSAFALNIVLGVLIYAGQGFLLGIPDNALFPGLSPKLFGLFLIGGQLIYTFACILIGNRLGGHAAFLPLFAALTWLGLVKNVVEAVAFALLFLMPPLAILLNLVTLCYGLYVLAHFSKESFGFTSLARALGVVVLAGLASMTALMFLMGPFVPTLLETSNV